MLLYTAYILVRKYAVKFSENGVFGLIPRSPGDVLIYLESAACAGINQAPAFRASSDSGFQEFVMWVVPASGGAAQDTILYRHSIKQRW